MGVESKIPANLTPEMQHYIKENLDLSTSQLEDNLGVSTEVIQEYILLPEVKKYQKKPTMRFFDNIDYIRDNCDLGVNALSKELNVSKEDLRKFMIVNDIFVI